MRINHFLTRSFHFSLLEGLPRLLPSHELQPYFEDEFFFFIIFLRFLNVNDIMALKYVGRMVFDKPRFYILKDFF